jgi:hypothetical protein
VPPFVIFALPRSRTAWLSQFLAYGDWCCGHEEARHARTVDDLKSWLALPNCGTVETSASPWWRTLRRLRPDANVVVVRRPVAEVVDSLSRLGLTFDRHSMTKGLERYAAKLAQISARWHGVLTVDYADLAGEAACKATFEKCLPYPHDAGWWARLSATNVQRSMPHLIRYTSAFKPQMDRLSSVLRHQEIAALRLRPPRLSNGVTLQVEPFETFLRDAAPLIADHLVAVGEPPVNMGLKNIPLMQTLSDLGNMQVVTARSNGRVFGYLMTIISPSLESRSAQIGVQTTFYASPDMPGVGMKLQRFSVQKLREEGRVDEIVFRAGVRGSGPEISPIYRRLGAVHDGELYRLNLRTM